MTARTLITSDDSVKGEEDTDLSAKSRFPALTLEPSSKKRKKNHPQRTLQAFVSPLHEISIKIKQDDVHGNAFENVKHSRNVERGLLF